MGHFDGIETAQTHANDHAHGFGEFTLDFKAAVLNRHNGRAERVLDEEIHLLDLFGLDEIVGFEVWHFTGDSRSKTIGGKTLDFADSRATVHQSVPVFLYAGTQW